MQDQSSHSLLVYILVFSEFAIRAHFAKHNINIATHRLDTRKRAYIFLNNYTYSCTENGFFKAVIPIVQHKSQLATI